MTLWPKRPDQLLDVPLQKEQAGDLPHALLEALPVAREKNGHPAVNTFPAQREGHRSR